MGKLQLETYLLSKTKNSGNCKGPKYREPVCINFSNLKTGIKNRLTKFSSDWCNKKGIPIKCFTQ